nr:hypothetical protein [Bifidobacterium pseudolongum]
MHAMHAKSAAARPRGAAARRPIHQAVVGRVHIGPLRAGKLRVGALHLLHELVADAKGRRIDHVPTPQHGVEHAAVAEFAEILHVPHQTGHLAGIGLALRRERLPRADRHGERGGEQQRQRDDKRERNLPHRRRVDERGEPRGDHRRAPEHARAHTDRHGGVQRLVFRIAGILKTTQPRVALAPILQRGLHLPEVEHGQANAFGRAQQREPDDEPPARLTLAGVAGDPRLPPLLFEYALLHPPRLLARDSRRRLPLRHHDDVNVFAARQVGHGELQRPIVKARRLARRAGVQPRP